MVFGAADDFRERADGRLVHAFVGVAVADQGADGDRDEGDVPKEDKRVYKYNVINK